MGVTRGIHIKFAETDVTSDNRGTPNAAEFDLSTSLLSSAVLIAQGETNTGVLVDQMLIHHYITTSTLSESLTPGGVNKRT